MWHRMWGGLRSAIESAVDYGKIPISSADSPARLSTLHLLWGIANVSDGTAADVLKRLGMPADRLKAAIDEAFPSECGSSDHSSLTDQARAAVERMYDIAAGMHENHVDSEHLLLALAQDGAECDAAGVLTGLGATYERIGSELMAFQPWRTYPPPGIAASGLSGRRFKERVKAFQKMAGQMAYGVKHYRSQPFMPYLMFRNRTIENPYPFYDRLRAVPVYWDALINKWVVTSYKDVVSILQETRFSHQQYSLESWNEPSVSPFIDREFRRLNGSLGMQMLFLDAPRQTRLRSLVGKQFTPRVIAGIREQIEEVTNDLLEKAALKGRLDVISELAGPLPAAVIAKMLGLADSDHPGFKKWSDDFITYIGGDTTLAQDLAAYRSLDNLSEYFREEIAVRRVSPTDDLITLFIQAEEKGERLTDDEIIANCLLMLAAGHETTTQLIGNGLLALLTHPEQIQKLRTCPDLIGPAVEELLRYDSPVQWTSRVVTKPFEWNGHRFAAGQEITLALAGANRDPARFTEPGKLDIERPENRHVAFGYGPHFCLGAALARLEGQIALNALVQRYPKLRLEENRPQWKGNFTFRALKHLRVALT